MVGRSANGVGVGKRLVPTVGGLVWVQRKNGSWWPGQIVGEEELSETDLAVPRSGTPIKLLGRDDTSVDWFDLETTKLVKAFRCGDYDTCIEKARVSAAKNSLKQTKYPRRENAIVCALEIEKTCMLKDCPDSDTRQNGEKGSSMSHPTNERAQSSEGSPETVSACDKKSNTTQELSQSGISYEETNGLTHIKGLQCRTRKRSRKSPNDSEEDGYEGIKRMKGLNDLGVDSEKKESILPLPNPSPQNSTLVENLCGANGNLVGALANGSTASTLKRKRSQVVHIHELLKREYPRRPMTKVLENTTMVPVRIICDEFANPFERSDAVSYSYECEESNKWDDVELSNGPLLEDDFPGILIDVPFVDEELHSSGLSPACQSSFPTKSCVDLLGEPGHDMKVQASFLGHDLLDESGLSYFSAGYMDQKVEKSASKWQSKGKRNARHLIKGEEPHSGWKGDVHDRLDSYKIGHENPGRLSPRSNGVVNGFTDSRNHNSMASPHRSFPYHQSRFLTHSDFELADVSPSSHPDTVLYEVEVTVEATRSQVQHVPYISLMSKVNGKPITGHPVAVEALEDGYCDPQSSDYPASGSCELDGEETEMEVIIKPKSHKKKKKAKHRSRLYHRKSSKSKKRHGSSSKKTRKLSSLSGAQKLSLVKRKPLSQTSKGPTLACIPLKVVFSRINEALNGSRSTHRVSNT